MSDKEVAKKGKSDVAIVDFGDHAGAGMENVGTEDMAMPFLGLLQDLSDEVKKKNEKYIEGAEPGMLFNTVTRELLGEEVFFVPAYRDHQYVEWVPRDQGGGYVDSHDPTSPEVLEAKAASQSFGKIKIGNNDLIETFYLYGFQIDGAAGKESVCPMVVAFTSSKIKVYKRIMTQIRTLKGFKNPPLYAFRLRIGSVGEQNKVKQDYHNFTVTPAEGDITSSMNLPGSDFEGLLEEGKQLLLAVKSGVARAATESLATEGGAAGDGDEPF